MSVKRFDMHGSSHINGEYVSYSDCAKLESQLDALKEESERLKARVAELEYAARGLRSCQKEYMLNRGNDEIGKSVAEAAKYLDEVLGPDNEC